MVGLRQKLKSTPDIPAYICVWFFQSNLKVDSGLSRSFFGRTTPTDWDQTKTNMVVFSV